MPHSARTRACAGASIALKLAEASLGEAERRGPLTWL